MGEFGEKFRKAREKKELSFDDVSNVIKISSRMLKAIEEENFDQLPGGVFNKGFIRAYAKHLGLNEEDAVADYLAQIRQAQIEADKTLLPLPAPKQKSLQRVATEKLGAVLSRRHAVPSDVQVDELPHLHLPRAEHVVSRKEFVLRGDREIPWRIVVIAVIILILASILWVRHSHRATSQRPQQSSVAPSLSSPIAAPLNAPPSQLSASANPSAHAPVSNPTTPAPASSRPTTSVPTKGASNVGTGTKSVDASAAATARLTLVIRANETSWVSVQADGETVSQETLIAPARLAVSAHREIVAKVGNAAGVSFVWNGQEIPVEGTESEVRTVVFDAAGMHVVTPAQAAPAR